MHEMILKPVELLYLAKLCHGNSLDYDYIMMLPHIQGKLALVQDECTDSLEKKGLIHNTWGDISVQQEMLGLLTPIWEDQFEAKLIRMQKIEGKYRMETVYLHGLKDNCSLVVPKEEGLYICNVDDEKKQALAVAWLPDEYTNATGQMISLEDDLDWDFIVKGENIRNGQAIIEEFFLKDGMIYRPIQSGGYRSIDAEACWRILYIVLKGEE